MALSAREYAALLAQSGPSAKQVMCKAAGAAVKPVLSDGRF
jgi:hypothetical protein